MLVDRCTCAGVTRDGLEAKVATFLGAPSVLLVPGAEGPAVAATTSAPPCWPWLSPPPAEAGPGTGRPALVAW